MRKNFFSFALILGCVFALGTGSPVTDGNTAKEKAALTETVYAAEETTGTDDTTAAIPTPVPTATPTPAPTATPTPAVKKVKSGLIKEKGKYYYYSNGKKVKNKWKKIKGSKYYFTSTGAAATLGYKIGNYIYVFDSKTAKLVQNKKAGIVKMGTRYYYVDTKGRAKTGWFTITVKGKTKLCFGNKAGCLKKNHTYNGITFDSNGYAKNSTRSQLKIKAMSVVSSITTSSMSTSQKLRACWNYVCGGNIRYSSAYYPNTSQSGWIYECALKALNEGRGNCYGYACAFAALANELGYDTYVVSGRVSGSRDGAADGMTRHCWVRLNGLYYDPEGQYAGWLTGVYGWSGYGISHQILAILKMS